MATATDHTQRLLKVWSLSMHATLAVARTKGNIGSQWMVLLHAYICMHTCPWLCVLLLLVHLFGRQHMDQRLPLLAGPASHLHQRWHALACHMQQNLSTTVNVHVNDFNPAYQKHHASKTKTASSRAKLTTRYVCKGFSHCPKHPVDFAPMEVWTITD